MGFHKALKNWPWVVNRASKHWHFGRWPVKDDTISLANAAGFGTSPVWTILPLAESHVLPVKSPASSAFRNYGILQIIYTYIHIYTHIYIYINVNGVFSWRIPKHNIIISICQHQFALDDMDRHKGGPVQTKFRNVRTCEINRDMGPEVFGRWVYILCFSCFARGG
jgi:hypothetical protein